MNVYGVAEYPALYATGLETERVVKPYILGSDTEVSKNYYLVTEDGVKIAADSRRSADDYQVFDSRCLGLNKPFTNCSGISWASTRATERPPCQDNNYSLNALTHCYTTDGVRSSEPCMQVAFSQNAFVALCNESTPHCGTYLEIHMANGSPYYGMDEVISSVKLNVRNVSGAYTTVIPTTFMGNSSRVLCSYSETYLRIGTPVYIKSSAPSCCCPATYSTTTNNGSVFCPKGATGNGPFATLFKSFDEVLDVDKSLLIYPYCPYDLRSKNDS